MAASISTWDVLLSVEDTEEGETTFRVYSMAAKNAEVVAAKFDHFAREKTRENRKREWKLVGVSVSGAFDGWIDALMGKGYVS